MSMDRVLEALQRIEDKLDRVLDLASHPMIMVNSSKPVVTEEERTALINAIRDTVSAKLDNMPRTRGRPKGSKDKKPRKSKAYWAWQLVDDGKPVMVKRRRGRKTNLERKLMAKSEVASG